MARTNLLNTRTTNFLELLGNGRVYQAPPYQRDYSWGEEQWEDLWADILDLRERPGALHYMGALVVEARSDREFTIIDGQQRLATLSILALAVIGKLMDMARQEGDRSANRERATGLRHRFIGEKDPASLVESSKLFLNETDNALYQDFLVQLRTPLNPRGLPKSNQLLWKCFQFFGAHLDQVAGLCNAPVTLAELLSEIVARQLMFILITVDDELSAYTVFETLNARGLELSATDLLKNYLFSQMRVPADLEALQRRWRALLATVGQEQFPDFLRYHLACEHPRIRSSRLFQLVRSQVRTAADVFGLLEALEGRAELFAALSDPHHSYWIERSECRPHIRELVLFRARQVTPLVFAAWEKFSAANFAGVLRIITVVTLRYSVVGGRSSNALESAYHRAARAVLDGKATQPSAVFALLREVYVDDTSFQTDFRLLALDTGGPRKKLVRYLLAGLEGDAGGRACNPDTDPGTIEHILPENPGDFWKTDFPASQWERSVYRLGNLTLLEAPTNRQIGNGDYPAKAAAYAASNYALTRAIPAIAPEHWSPELLDARQARLAARALHLWRLDFA